MNTETHDEEEAKSEGSAGSEWLVVSQDKGSGSSEPKSSPTSPISEGYVMVYEIFLARLVYVWNETSVSYI